MASCVPATTRSSLGSRSVSSGGFTTKLPSSSMPTRTAPTGTSTGMSEIWIAADAPFIASTSYGLTWSIDIGIATSWVSRRQPFGKSGRIGRSIMRAVSVPFSPARPSRLKNEPGILPAAYMRSSTSTVRGRKSTSRRLPMVAVLRTIVSPWRTTTAPEACLAILPVSNEISLPEISTETVVTASLLICAAFPGPPVGRRADSSCFSYSEHHHGIEQVRVVRGDPHGRRRGRTGAQRVVDVALHAPGDGVAAAVAVEALEVDPEPLAAGPEMRVLEAALVLVQGVGELPEPALDRGRLGRGRARERAGVLRLEREVAVRHADGRVLEPRVGERALRAGEVAVEQDERGAVGPADVVVRPERRDLGAAQVGHLAQSYARSFRCPCLRSTSCGASSGWRRRPPSSSRSSPTPATSRRSPRRCWASAS